LLAATCAVWCAGGCFSFSLLYTELHEGASFASPFAPLIAVLTALPTFFMMLVRELISSSSDQR